MAVPAESSACADCSCTRAGHIFICVLCQRLKKQEFFRFNKCVLLNRRTMEEKVISRVEECLVFVASVFDFLYAHRVSCDVFITSPFYINKYTSYNLH